MTKHQERLQKSYDEIEGKGLYIEYGLDFSGFKNDHEISQATCKLLSDNFGIAEDGTYIKEIIEQACYQSALAGVQD